MNRSRGYTLHMKAFNLALPPDTPGLYALVNATTGMIYIGRSTSLKRRYGEWRGVVGTGVGAKSQSMLEATLAGRAEDWTFNVLFEFPGATDEELAGYEHRAIHRAYDAKPNALLNVIVPHECQGNPRGNSPRTVVTDNSGNPVPYREAATSLGCSYKTLQKRLARYRNKGKKAVQLDDLRAMSERCKAEKN